jgi:hypothetical protein
VNCEASVSSTIAEPETGNLQNGTLDGTNPTVTQSTRKGELRNGVDRVVETSGPLPQTSSPPNAVDGVVDTTPTQPYTSTIRDEVDGIDGAADAKSGGQLHVMCGPLLNYQGMAEEGTQTSWHGSVLLVVEPGPQVPHLKLLNRGPAAQADAPKSAGLFSRVEEANSIEGLKLYGDPIKMFWRFTLRIPLFAAETRWEYSIPNMHFRSEVSTSPSREFVVPAVSQSMRLMFHSCNGFSVGTDEDYWSGKTHSIR